MGEGPLIFIVTEVRHGFIIWIMDYASKKQQDTRKVPRKGNNLNYFNTKHMTLRNIIPALLLLSALGTTSLSAQHAKDTPDKMIDTIVGSWKIQKILSGKRDMGKNETSGQWIEFMSDGKYVNHAAALDSGSYRTDENQLILYVESNVYDPGAKNSPVEIGEWYVTFQEGTMILQRNDNKPSANKTKYIYARIGDGSRAVSR